MPTQRTPWRGGCYPLTFLRHSSEQRRMQRSFQLGTWCGLTHTVRRHASVHASSTDVPHTVTQVSGVGSLENAPTLLSMRGDVQTRSQTKCSGGPSLEGAAAADLSGGASDRPGLASPDGGVLSRVAASPWDFLANSSAGTAAAAATPHQSWPMSPWRPGRGEKGRLHYGVEAPLRLTSHHETRR